MPKHKVIEVLEVVPDYHDHVEVHLRLECGCSIRKRIGGERVLEGPNRATLGPKHTWVRWGLFECPVGHPPRADRQA